MLDDSDTAIHLPARMGAVRRNLRVEKAKPERDPFGILTGAAEFSSAAQHRFIGMAYLAQDGKVLERHGALSQWLPEPGKPCFTADLLVGMETQLMQQRTGAAEDLVMPGLKLRSLDGSSLDGSSLDRSLGDQTTVTISISWESASATFLVVTLREFGSHDLELLVTQENRLRRLAEEEAARARQALAVGEARYKDIVERGSDLVLRLDASLRLMFVNTEALNWLGKEALALLSRPVDEVLATGEDITPWTFRLQQGVVGAPQTVSFEQEMGSVPHGQRWVWWNVTWLGHDGGVPEYQAVGRDVTRLRELRLEVERLAQEAKLAAVSRERLRIAHDLHDTLAHSLVAVLTQIRLMRKLAVSSPDALPEGLEQAELATRQGLQHARAAIGQVRYQLVSEDGLGNALERCLYRLRDRGGIAVSLDIDPLVGVQSDARAEALFRMTEEGVRNIDRHAQASAVSCTARMHETTAGQRVIKITLTDDGVGFDPGQAHPGHYGLVGLREQAALIGATVEIVSAPGQGTTLSITA